MKQRQIGKIHDVFGINTMNIQDLQELLSENEKAKSWAKFRGTGCSGSIIVNSKTVEQLVRIALAAVALRREIDDDGYPRVYGNTSHGHGVGGQTMCSAFPDVLLVFDAMLRDAGLIE